MPYVFPHEDVFVGVISLIIIGLLFLRWYMIKRQSNNRPPGASS